MSEKPILFSAPMVRAILAGQKTQTRRILKPQPSIDFLPEVGRYAPTLVDRNGEQYPGPEVFGASDEREAVKFPFGQPGSRLWVKETWATDWVWNESAPVLVPEGQPILYRADECATGCVAFEWGRWRPSIFMRRWMARITLEITALRCERLRDIEHKPLDLAAEGHPRDSSLGDILWYSGLWESINGPGSWEANPFVWVVEFRRVAK